MHGHRNPGGFGPGPFGFGPFARHGRGPGGRARRGDVQPAILALLKEQDMHGYQIIQELSDRSGGAWTPSPGSVYPTLSALEDQGLVTSTQVAGKRVFSLTDEGRALAEKQPDAAPWEAFTASGPKAALRQSMFSLGGAAMQVMQGGSDEQAEQVSAILDEARKRIYMMLAGE
jgi:DNA-binding PadR family transcriptional regulator